jgi:thiamine pyrophosphate-dependent acetolactate synthase large subunit-like protein
MMDSPNFAAIADGMGADGYTVRTQSDLDPVTEELHTGVGSPTVIDCKINHDINHRLVE